jgi:hypothetical protein
MMTHDTYGMVVRRAAATGDWMQVERITRAYGWSLLWQAIRRLVRQMAAEPAAPRPLRRP